MLSSSKSFNADERLGKKTSSSFGGSSGAGSSGSSSESCFLCLCLCLCLCFFAILAKH